MFQISLLITEQLRADNNVRDPILRFMPYVYQVVAFGLMVYSFYKLSQLSTCYITCFNQNNPEDVMSNFVGSNKALEHFR